MALPAIEMGPMTARAELVVVEGAAHGMHSTKPAAFAALAERAVSLARASDPAT